MLARLSQIALPPLLLAAALLVYRVAFVRVAAEKLAAARPEAITIAPRFDEPRVVTNEQLAAVLDRVLPPTTPLKTNNIVHALRLWGASADFGDAKVPSGSQMRDYLLDDRVYRQMAGERAPPIFYRDVHGLAVRSYDDATTDRDTSSYHTDDLLATLAETNTPLGTPLVLRDGQATVGELLGDSLARFHLDRLEYEWSLISYARYVFPQPHFRNQWGERITVDQLIAEAIGPPLELGPCNGLHRLEALVILIRADDEARTLHPRSREKVIKHLRHAGDLLVQAQTVEGYWTRQWPQGAAAAAPAAGQAGDVYDHILVTGHHLEWLALAPEEVQPPRETVVRAGQWLARTLLALDQHNIEAAYGPYTHAARALALWRGKDAYQAWSQARRPGVSLSAAEILGAGDSR